MERYDGINGQILIDHPYVWITREGLAAEADFPFPTHPRRALLSAVQRCRFVPGSEDGPGFVHIHVQGAGAPGDGVVSHPDVVLCDASATPAILEFTRSLARYCEVVVHTEEAPQEPADKFLTALDALEGLASVDEIIMTAGLLDESQLHGETFSQLADELDTLDDDARMTWGWVGDGWFVAGGHVSMPEEDRGNRLRELARLARTLRGDAGTKQVAAAVAGTPLAALSTMRLAQLWENIAPELPETPAPPAVKASPLASPNPLATPVQSTATSAPPSPNMQPAPKPVSKVQPVPAAPASPKLQEPVGSAAVGRRWRVYLDCAGFRTLAVCDPMSGETNITKGELKGRRFPDPSSAAAAVIDRHDPGEAGDPDGWELWILHDKSGRPLSVMREDGARAERAPVGHVHTSFPGVQRSDPAKQAGTADLGIEWFLKVVRAKGACGERVTTSRRTAVRLARPGAAPLVVRVKTRTAGTWQAQKSDERLANDDTGAEFWAFVDLSISSKSIYILAAEDVADGIRRATDAWVARDPRRERKGHHAIELDRVAHGRNRWDLLGLPL